MVLGKLSVARHLAVGVTAVGASALALIGVIGGGIHEERFEAKQVVVTPTGEDGVRIREVVDQDFGSHDRHGHQRIIPNDFGVPTDIEASSPDAPDEVSAMSAFDETTIRIGDPDRTIDGQHRYVLAYTLPDAHLDSGELALDIIGNDEELETGRFEIVVTGFELEDPRCNVGAFGGAGGCELARDGDVYRAVVEDLEPGEGITIGGRIVGRTPPVDVDEPPLPERRNDNRLPLALTMLPLSLATGAGGYALARHRGRNEVYAGGAADAAYGTGPILRPMPGAPLPPPDAAASTTPIVPTTTSVRYVADQDMDELATIEFVPPAGIDPWLGAVVLGERVDANTVGAWFSGLAAKGVIDIERDDEGKKGVTISWGDRPEAASREDLALVRELFSTRERIRLGTYSKDFASVWRKVQARQQDHVRTAGLWKRMPPGSSGCNGGFAPFLIVAGIWLAVGAGGALAALGGLVGSPVAAVALGIIATGLVAFAAYRSLLPVRSAQGSAIALRTESFRRFLAASEGQHVEWAWKYGLLREYSAWAVALGAASTWERALEASSVPPTEYVSGPLVVYSMGPSFTSSHTPPSSSGSSGGGSGFSGGFSGGSVGGGGGGGSSGSW